MKMVSIIVPCYNEEESIPIFHSELINSIESIRNKYLFEIIFINDGSYDNTLNVIKDLSKKDNDVKYISFSRNFGKESALYAGLNECNGDYITVIDVDLQDPPNLIPEMLLNLESNEFDIVATRRTSRKGEPIIRSFFARTFYKLITQLSNIELYDGTRDYRMMTRQVVNSILKLEEYNRFSKGLFNWVGFRTKWIEYENIERIQGQTSWSFWSLFKYSIEALVAFTTIPLSISTVLGMIISLSSFLIILILIIQNILYSNPVPGWTSIVCMILLLGGIQLLSIGILGKYLEKTYIEIKNRPLYIIKESNIE